MNENVKKATTELFTQVSHTDHLKVAAYVRVSTEVGQQNSYDTQFEYFQNLIYRNSDWEYVGIYVDHGISGTDKSNRTGFKRLLRHCRQGRINRVLCKSISRFTRNTADLLEALQTLKENRVTIYFEKENIDTQYPLNEFILTALGSIAQEESHSISQNITWSYKKRFEKGAIWNIPIYGYRIIMNEPPDIYEGCKIRKMKLHPEEADVVRMVFAMAAKGHGFRSIARTLNLKHIPAPVDPFTLLTKLRKESEKTGILITKKGLTRPDIDVGWTDGRVRHLLTNERYCGEVLLQKKFTADFLTHKVQRNHGEKPQYLVKNHHLPIVSHELFSEVQKIINTKTGRAKVSKHKTAYPFSKRIICAHCGRYFVTRNRRNYPRWYCPNAVMNNGKNICHAEVIYEEQFVRMIRRAFVERYKLFAYCFDDQLFAGYQTDKIRQSLAPPDYHFTEQMKTHILYHQTSDTIEFERSFLKRSLDLECELGHSYTHIQELSQQLRQLETYWAELEDDYIWREKALKWLDTLPTDNYDSIIMFLNGLNSEYVRAWILSITVYSPLDYSVHWFDNTTTNVHMFDNIEDYRLTKQYYSNHVNSR